MRILKNLLSIVLLGAFVCAVWAQPANNPPAGSPVARHGQLSVSGNRIVDKDGNPVQLRGMSFFWNNWGGGFYSTATVEHMAKDWKVSVLRLAVDPQDGTSMNIDPLIDEAIRQGIYIIVDWHSHCAEDAQAAAISYFQTKATKYKNYPNIIYEIYNEPIGPKSGGGSCHQTQDRRGSHAVGTQAQQEAYWRDVIKPYSQALVSAIRAIDDNIIIIGTGDYSKRVDIAAANKVSGTNLAYAVHYYSAESGTHHTSTLRSYCTIALNLSNPANGIALFVSEFGISEASGDGKIDTVEANTWFRFLDQYQIGWANWSIMNKGESSSAISGGTSPPWNSGNLTTSGRYIRGKLEHYASNTNNVLTVGTEGQGSVVRVNHLGAQLTGNPNNTTYRYGEHVTLAGVPAQGWDFAGWTGSGSGTNNRIIGMYGNQSVTARFVLGGNLISNGGFSSGTTGWTVVNSTAPAAGSPSGAFSVENSQGVVTFGDASRVGNQAGHSYLFQNSLDIKSGRRYKLSFDAHAVKDRQIGITVCHQDARTVTKYLDNLAINLTAQSSPFVIEFDVVSSSGQLSLNKNGQLEFWFGGNSTGWFLSNVRLMDLEEATGKPPTVNGSTNIINIKSRVGNAANTAWSVVRTGAGLQLRSPAGSVDTKVSLYDVRGRLVKSVSLNSGNNTFLLNKTVAPAGNYLLVVRNAVGREVYKTRVALVN